jgi:hypothetical protein
MGVWYTTRESVQRALDVATTARADRQVDDAIEAASRDVEDCTHRRFYPWTGTRYLDWPDRQQGTSYRLWLDENELISATSVTSGGIAIPSGSYNLEPNGLGPPYDHIELKLSTNATFGLGNTHQRDVAITGLFGYRNDEQIVATLTAAVTGTGDTALHVDDPARFGVGSLLRVDNERMIVTSRTMTSSGQTVQTPLSASAANVTVAVTNGSVFFSGEVILLDSERILVVDVAGNNLTVKRAQDGSVLAAHSGSTIYRETTLTVERGVVGTTAATHLSGASVNRWEAPGPVRQLVRAAAIDQVMQEQSGYARTVGSGETQRNVSTMPLTKLRERVERNYRRIRVGVV